MIETGGGQPLAAHNAAKPQLIHRPMGLSVLAVLAAVVGGVLLMWAGVWFGVAHVASASTVAAGARFIGAVLVVVAALELVLAHGIWTLRAWAWPLGVGLMLAAIALTLLSAGRGAPGAHTLSLILEIVALWYLLSPRAREALRA
jgi:hypothetical protein